MGLSRAQVMKYFERQRKKARAIASGDMPKRKRATTKCGVDTSGMNQGVGA